METAIRNPDELFMTLMAKDVLTEAGLTVSLDIRYLMGARMDRPISAYEPFTLAIVTRLLLSAGFAAIRVLDPHSDVTCDRLGARPVLPVEFARQVLASLPPDVLAVAPDHGARTRTRTLMDRAGYFSWRMVQGHKHRDPSTGALSGFSVDDASIVRGRHCIIVDDLCDGGGTFTGLAKVLLDNGAAMVDLCVTHGIFSKGTTLEHINHIYTTDSYCNSEGLRLTCFPIRMQDMQ
jgi:ribose-phosphate pyrophosphokinase